MGKESTANKQLSKKKFNQRNDSNTKLSKNKIYIPESLFHEKPQYTPKKLDFYEETNSSKKDKNNYRNKFNDNSYQFITSFPYPENKVPRKISGASEGASTSDENSSEKKNTKKTFQKKNKNKIPFKCEAKDFKVKYKTELCKNFEINGYCKYGDKCAYAHGIENLRSKVTNTTAYRTKKCVQFFEQGYCPYGSRCQFAHQLKSNIINNPYDKNMTYEKILETISKLENVENIKKLIEKPRLSCFQEICDNKENTQSRLLEDIKGLTYDNLYKRVDN